jgi:hypothetical protein
LQIGKQLDRNIILRRLAIGEQRGRPTRTARPIPARCVSYC